MKQQWIKYVKTWNKEKFGVAEYLGGKNNEPLADQVDYIVRCIRETVTSEKFPLSEDVCDTIISIIFDGYNIEHGIEGLLEILKSFVKRTDLEKK